MLLVVLFRAPLLRLLNDLVGKLAPGGRFLVAPLLATVVFTMSWASIYYTSSAQAGFVPQTLFPAVVGLYTFALARWGGLIRRILGDAYFGWRDRYPFWLRLAVAIGVPVVLSLTLTAGQYVPNAALTAQFVVLVALLCGYLATVPRRDDPLAEVRRAIRPLGART
jgi:hypothetical protein